MSARSARPAVVGSLACALLAPVCASTWSGAINGDFSNPGNWSDAAPLTGDALVFGATSGATTLVNDQTEFTYSTLTFTRGASAYTLGGNAFTLGAGGIVNNSGALQTIAAPFSGGTARPLITSAGGGDLLMIGSITGSGRLAKSGNGTLTITGANNVTGSLSLGSTSFGDNNGGSSIFANGSGTGGVVKLDFSAAGSPTSNILYNGAAAGALNVYSGTLRVVGAAGATNTQAFGNTVVRGGFTTIALEAGADGGAALNLGTLTRSSTAREARTGMLNIVLPGGTQSATNGVTTTTTALTNGILNTGGAFATVNSSDWATLSGSNVVGLSAGAYTANTGSALGTSTQHVNFVTDATLGANATISTLRFAVAAGGGLTNTLTLGASNQLTISAGGILVTAGVGAGDVTIQGGTIIGANARSLSIFQYNTTGALIVDSVIGDASLTGLNVGGGGKVVLRGANTYAGFTTVSGGSTLSIGSNANLGAVATAATVGLDNGTLQATATFTLDNGGANARNIGVAGDGIIEVTGAHTLTVPGVVGGAGDLVKAGTGTLLLRGANTYTGATRIDTGTLALGAAGTLASQSFTIAEGATFDVSAKSAYALAGVTTIGVGASEAGLFNAGALTTLTFGGELVLDLATASFSEGQSFDLFVFDEDSAGGSFSSVTLGGSVTGSLLASLEIAGLWSNTLGGYTFNFDAASGVLSVASAVPEPASWSVLAGLGALGFGAVRRRRRA